MVLVVKIIFAVVLNRATLDAFAHQTKRWVAEKIGCKLKYCCRGLRPLIASSNQIQPFFLGELVPNCTQKSYKKNVLLQTLENFTKFDQTPKKNLPDLDRFLVLSQVFLPDSTVLRVFQQLVIINAKSFLG